SQLVPLSHHCKDRNRVAQLRRAARVTFIKEQELPIRLQGPRTSVQDEIFEVWLNLVQHEERCHQIERSCEPVWPVRTLNQLHFHTVVQAPINDQLPREPERHVIDL